MEDRSGSLRSKYPELYKVTPKKTNDLEFLKTSPSFRRGLFHWYSNPQIGYRHCLDPSRKERIGQSKKKFGKTIGSQGSYPFSTKY